MCAYSTSCHNVEELRFWINTAREKNMIFFLKMEGIEKQTCSDICMYVSVVLYCNSGN